MPMMRQWIVSIGDNIIDLNKRRGDNKIFTDEEEAKQFARDRVRKGFGVRVQLPNGEIINGPELVAWISVPYTSSTRPPARKEKT